MEQLESYERFSFLKKKKKDCYIKDWFQVKHVIRLDRMNDSGYYQRRKKTKKRKVMGQDRSENNSSLLKFKPLTSTVVDRLEIL